MPFHRRLGNAQHLGGLLISEPGEETQLHHLRLLGVVLRQTIQRFVQREQLLVVNACGEVKAVEIYALRGATVAQAVFAAGVVNEDAPHGFRSSGEEMPAIVPRGLVVTAQS